jgi:hypothetical protein
VVIDKTTQGIEETRENTAYTDETEVTLPGLNRTYIVENDATQAVQATVTHPRKYMAFKGNGVGIVNEANFGAANPHMNNLTMYPQQGMQIVYQECLHHQISFFKVRRTRDILDKNFPQMRVWYQ